MSPNHRPPEPAPRPIGPAGFFTGVKLRPVIAGVIVDYVATYVLGMVYLIVFYQKEFSEGVRTFEEAVEKALDQMLSSPESFLALGIIGAVGTALGGYVAGRLAQAHEVKHGALVGLVSLILGVLQTSVTGQPIPLPYWYELLAYIIAVPAGALGGYFARREMPSRLSA